MGKKLVLLISLLTVVFLVVSTQSNQRKTTENKSTEKTENSTKVKGDDLLEWMNSKKKEYQEFRSSGDILRSMEVLSQCIDSIWRKPATNEEFEKLGWIYTSRAYMHQESFGDFLAAKDDYLAALKQFDACEPSDFLVARYVYQPLGNIYTRLGENEIAISMLEKFKRVCEENDETEALMNAYNDIARAYLNKSAHEEAIELFTEGIALDDSDDLNLGLLYSSRAEVEEEIGKYDQSVISANKSIEYLKKVINGTEPSDYRFDLANKYLVSSLRTKAKLHNHAGDVIDAHKFYSEALQLSLEIYPDKHRAIGRSFVGLGNSYNNLDNPLGAIECYQSSLRSMVGGVKSDVYSENPSKSDLYADVVLGEALFQKAMIAHKLFNKTSERSWLEISAQTYMSYFDWVEIHRSEQFEFNSKLGTAKEIHKTGESALAAFIDLFQETKDKRWIDSAFLLMDQTKAIVLAEERGFRELANQNPQMRDLLKQQNALKYQRALFMSDIREAEEQNEVEDVSRLKKRLSELDLESQFLDQEIRSLFPAYRTQASAALDKRVIQKLTKKLKNRNTTILSYFVGENWVYFISGIPGNFEFSKIDNASFQVMIQEFLSELNDPVTSQPQKFAQKGNELLNALIGAQLNKLGEKWVVFPDGILNKLPFEVLVSNASSNNHSFKKLSYLVNDHVIQYAPSAYFFAQDEVDNKAEKSFLGMAPVFKQSQKYDYLPKSVEELEAGVKQFSGKEVTNKEATKKRFFKEAEQYDILHISTHAGSNTGENNNAWMVFSDAASKDHRLVATELLKLDLPASLVVLNACETGSGTVFKGEGPMSLARGFLDAGSQSTVTNLWKVNHESNALIMKAFYENLSETQSPSRSLNEAKRAYLLSDQVDEISAHPYYWSSAILIGTDVSVSAPSGGISTWIWIALGSGLALIFGFVWFRKRKKSAV